MTAPAPGVPTLPGRYRVTGPYIATAPERSTWFVNEKGQVRHHADEARWYWPNDEMKAATWTRLPDEPAPLPALTDGARVRYGQVERVWSPSNATDCAGIIHRDDMTTWWVPRGMEQHVVPVVEQRPEWTLEPGACGLDDTGRVWQRMVSPSTVDLWVSWQTALSSVPWVEVPPLRQLTVVEEQG